MRKKLWLLLLIPLSCVLCALLIWGADAYVRWSRENYTPEEIIMVEDGWIKDHVVERGAMHLDGFSMAISRMKTESYPDENGVMKQGPVAYLYMWTAEPNADRPSDELYIWLHKGQEVTFGGYRIRVTDIYRYGGLLDGYYIVDLLIKPPETQ